MAVALLLTACSPGAISSGAASASPSSTESPSEQSAAPVASASSASAAPGVAWTELAPGGPTPPPREDHTWVITPDGATAYLFGGRDGGTVFDDLWAYDMATDAWSEVTDAGPGPEPRFGHNAAWAEEIGLVVFAGQGDSGFFNDLWAYDPVAGTWRALPGDGATPVSRYGSCAAIGPDGRLWISHGFTSEGQRFADTRAYDFATDTWTDETPAGDAPVERCLHACWWTDADALVLYAGQTTGATALGDEWRLHPGPRPGTNRWEQLAPSGGLPPDRNLYASARWGAATLVFGGQALDGTTLGDTWLLADADGAATALVVSGAGPGGRAGAELIADPARGRLLLFGGRSGPVAFDELWQLTLP